MQALESTGFLDDQGMLQIDKPVNIINQKVKVILLIPEQEETEHQVWLESISANPTFDFLKEEAEAIYSITDGEPLINKL